MPDWQFTATPDVGTRLVTRIRVSYDRSHPLTALMGLLLMEFGDFAMLRRMLIGIRTRAETLALSHPPALEIGSQR